MNNFTYGCKCIFTILSVVSGIGCFATGVINLVISSSGNISDSAHFNPIFSALLIVFAIILWFDSKLLWE